MTSGTEQQRSASFSSREISLAVERVVERYKAAPTGDRHYASAKLRWDAIGRELLAECAANGPFGRLLDVGCGRGQLGLFLFELGAATEVFGFDSDERKACVAEAALPGHYWHFDLRTLPFDSLRQLVGSIDTVLVTDVLHYLTLEEQQQTLERSVSLLGSGGRLILCDTARAPTALSVLYRTAEQLALRIGYNRRAEDGAAAFTCRPNSAAPIYPNRAELAQRLGELGMQVNARMIRGGAHYLLIARRHCFASP